MAAGKTSHVLTLALALLFWSAPGSASPSAQLDELRLVGSGEMRWLGMDIYAARLLNSAGRYDGGTITGPMALEITYRRNISRERLVSTTEREWRRLGRELGLAGRPHVQGWLRELGTIWPDVAPGDRIIALVEPGGQTRFYGNAGLLGAVADPEFGPAFLGIWLHPETRAAELRAGLLGGSQ